MSVQLYANVEERRDKLQIYCDIIKVATRAEKITRILRLANVQYNTFQECIEKLVKAGLLVTVQIKEKKNRSKKSHLKVVYKATEQGLKWCENIEEIYNTLEVY